MKRRLFTFLVLMTVSETISCFSHSHYLPWHLTLSLFCFFFLVYSLASVEKYFFYLKQAPRLAASRLDSLERNLTITIKTRLAIFNSKWSGQHHCFMSPTCAQSQFFFLLIPSHQMHLHFFSSWTITATSGADYDQSKWVHLVVFVCLSPSPFTTSQWSWSHEAPS